MAGTSGSRIVADVDFDRNGRQHGFLRLFHSVHSSAYGFIPIPIVVLKNGTGPTALLVSGTHGDEYEGQVALCNLVKSLDPARIRGRVIILPAANFPAAMAGRRTSPIDEGNLNRLFPGDPDGTVTEQIAYHIEHELVPMADLVCDLHSGGSSLMYVPSALFGGWQRDGSTAEGVAALKAFGSPIAYVAEANQGGATHAVRWCRASWRDLPRHRGRRIRPRHARGAAHGRARRGQRAGASRHPARRGSHRTRWADAVPGGRWLRLLRLCAGATGCSNRWWSWARWCARGSRRHASICRRRRGPSRSPHISRTTGSCCASGFLGARCAAIVCSTWGRISRCSPGRVERLRRRARGFECRDQGGPVPAGAGDCRDGAGQARGQDAAAR